MKLLILTQYFPPEIGAPQNRLFDLALRLHKLGVEVTVLTAMPNYPQMEIYPEYRGKKYVYESLEGLSIHRSSIYVSKSKSIVSRLRNYFSFVLSSALSSGKLNGNFDFLLCESPPLFLGYSAMYLSRRKKAKLIFNVSDLWPESAEKLNVVTNKTLLNQAHKLEARLYKKATLVTGQTQGICKNINSRFPDVKTYWLPNGVDLAFYDPSKVMKDDWRGKNNLKESDFVFLYAGILGIAQGLQVILEAASFLTQQTQLQFVFLGSGPEKPRLETLKKKLNLTNVHFLNPVSRKEMPSVLKSVNASIIPLRKLDLFLGAIPSKLFESMAMEIPVLLGVDGEARLLFIDEGNCGIYFEPENAAHLAAAIKTISANKELATTLGSNGRKYVAAHFDREVIAQFFHKQLSKL